MTDTEGWKGRRAAPPGELSALIGRLDNLGTRLRALETAAPLQSASISSGGLTIKDGGNLTVLDGGGVAVQGGGDLTVSGGGDVIIDDGGNVTLLDGGDLIVDGGIVRIEGDDGAFVAEHPDGSTAAMFGPLWPDASPGVVDSRGLLVQSTSSDNNRDIFRAKRVLADGTKVVYAGQSTDSGHITAFRAWAVDTSSDVTNTWIVSVSGTTKLYIASDGVRITGPTTGSAANVRMDPSTGLLHQVTSSLRFKQDVADLDLTAEQVLALRPVTWRDKGEVEADPDTTQRYPGFIAEEVHDAGLTQFVVYDADGQPYALQSERFAAAHQVVLQDHEARLAAQADLIASLTARLEALEAS
jgi:hypothetical protein